MLSARAQDHLYEFIMNMKETLRGEIRDFELLELFAYYDRPDDKLSTIADKILTGICAKLKKQLD